MSSREVPIRHIAYIGSVQPYKGALVFEEIFHRLSPQLVTLRWSVYGSGNPSLLLRLRRLPHLRIRGYYRTGSLVKRLLRDRVDLALLLSIVPETFSLALSECFAAGVPVVAFDHGAIAERVRNHGGGVLVELAAGAPGIASTVATLVNDRVGKPLPRACPSEPLSSEAAAAAMLALYVELGLA
jgi:glycosyltransferase involved in cell wall biosynthesis